MLKFNTIIKKSNLASELGEPTLRVLPNENVDDLLLLESAKNIRSSLFVAIIGTTMCGIVLAPIFWFHLESNSVWFWLAGLFMTAGLRISAVNFSRDIDKPGNQIALAKRFLTWNIFSNFVVGLSFAYGWFFLLFDADVIYQLSYAMVLVALMFGGLYVYSTSLVCFLTFILLAIFSAPLLLLGSEARLETFGLTFGLALVGFVSCMFAYRFKRAFETSFLLRLRVLQLLSEVTAQKNQAVKENLGKSHFFASISHDLRQPMHSINLYAEVMSNLLSKKRVSEQDLLEMQASIQNLKDSSHYLNEMFEGLLDLSRVDAGVLQAQVNFQAIDSLVLRLFHEYKDLAAMHGIEMSMRTSVDLNQLQALVDLTMLERILRNFLSNAVRYTERGSIQIRLLIKRDRLQIKVIDSGIGFSHELKKIIFDEFAKKPIAETPKRYAGRLGYRVGLGLVISKKLADLMNANIEVRSRPKRGSIFTLSVPFRFAEGLLERADEANVEEAPHESNPELIQGRYVVIVDDDELICQSTSALVRSMAGDVVWATSGKEIIEKLGSGNRIPDLILCDYRLNNESGIDVIHSIWDEFNAEIPALIITADTSPEHVRLFRQIGVKVIHKPVVPESLKSAILNELLIKDA